MNPRFLEKRVSVQKQTSLRKHTQEIDLLKTPYPLRMTGDISKNCKLYKQALELYPTVNTPQDKLLTDAAKTALVLSLVGEDVIDIFNNFTINEGESSESYETVVRI